MSDPAGDGKIDFASFKGKSYPPFSMSVAADHIAAFAEAIDEADPIHRDLDAACAAGYRNIVAPLTYAFTLTLNAGQSFNVLADMGVPKTRAVHGEQWFDYHESICAGDTLSGVQTITDIAEKKGGALIFIKIETPLSNQLGEHVVTLGSTIVVRNG